MRFVRQFIPVLTGAFTVALFAVLCNLAGFYDHRPHAHADLDFLALPLQTASAEIVDSMARLTWGLSATMLFICLVVVALKCAEIWWAMARSRSYVGVGALVLMAAAFVSWLFLMKTNVPYQGEQSAGVLSALWSRSRLPIMGTVIDIGNLMAMEVCIALVFALSALLYEPKVETVAILADRTHRLSALFYLCAALLAVAVFEIAALQAWSWAPFPGSGSAKVLVDEMAKLRAITGITPPVSVTVELEDLIRHADTVDDLKRASQMLIVAAGLGFSLLLASVYAPAYLLLRQRFRRHVSLERLDLEETLKKYELETSTTTRVLEAVASAAPFLISIIGALTGLFTPGT